MLAHAPVVDAFARQIPLLENCCTACSMRSAKVLRLIGNMNVSCRWACDTIPHSGRPFLKRAIVGKRPPRRTPIQSAFLILEAAVGAWIDRRREQKTLARLDERLLRDTGPTRSEHSETRVKPLWFAATGSILLD